MNVHPNLPIIQFENNARVRLRMWVGGVEKCMASKLEQRDVYREKGETVRVRRNDWDRKLTINRFNQPVRYQLFLRFIKQEPVETVVGVNPVFTINHQSLSRTCCGPPEPAKLNTGTRVYLTKDFMFKKEGQTVLIPNGSTIIIDVEGVSKSGGKAVRKARDTYYAFSYMKLEDKSVDYEWYSDWVEAEKFEAAREREA